MTQKMPMKKRRQDIWEEDCKCRRYLEDTSDADLAQRFRDILFNCHTVTKTGQLGFVTDSGAMQRWLPLLSHIRVEFNLRGGTPAGLASREDLPFISYPKPPTGYEILSGKSLPRKGLFKLGKKEHLATMFEEGQVRIAPASSYGDPSLNPAIQDEELFISTIALKSEISANAVNKETSKTGPKLEILGNVRITESCFDFYVYCMSERYDYRLLDDFEATALVAVHDHKIFAERLLHGIKETYGDGYKYMWVPVYYIDPYNFDPSCLSPYFGKHFRYSYQKEMRFLMVPNSDQDEVLEEFYINIGPMTDIAELY